MGYLMGLDEYLSQNYEASVFEEVMRSGEAWVLQLHGSRAAAARIIENRKWDVTVQIEGGAKEEIQKIQVKYLYPARMSGSVEPLIRKDPGVSALKLEPNFSPRKRNYVKNKSLFPIMVEKEVLFFFLLEGEILRGIVGDFTRYDMTVNLKGGLPVTILRHAIYDLKNKNGRCFLKSFQEEHRDWEKSPLYIAQNETA